MNAHAKFDVNLDEVLTRLTATDQLRYSVWDALHVIAEVPATDRDLFAMPFADVSKLFVSEASPQAMETEHWLIQHHNLVPHPTHAGFVQIAPASDPRKAHKVYGFGYQTLAGGETAFSPLYAISLGEEWFPGLRFFSRTSFPEQARFPDKPTVGNKPFSSVPAAS